MVYMLMYLLTINVFNMFLHRELNHRQRKFLELLKDFGMSVHYHPGKANVMPDALSRLSMGSVSHIDNEKKELAK